MIAAIYARKSTAEPGASEDAKSITRQVEHARAFAEARGWTVPDEHVYTDDGISGAEFEGRPGFVRLMAALKPAPFRYLILSEVSRLGREQIATSYALRQLVQADVEVWTYLDGERVSLDSPMDKIMAALDGFASELEREKARQRTKDALVRKARAGYVTGGRTFGYDNHEVLGPDGERSHVERRINEEEAEVVREIFRLCAAGLGKGRIARELNERGAVSPRAQQGRPSGWAQSSVGAVLGRSTYRGVIVWNKSKKRDRWGRQDQKPRPKSEWMEIEAPELRIVSDAEWKAAHDRLAATRAVYLRHQNGQLWGRPKSGTTGKYLLTGMSRCASCGGGLEIRTWSNGKGRPRSKFYTCSSRYRRGKSVCGETYLIPMKAADRAVLNTVLDEILTPDRLAEVARRAIAKSRAEREAAPDLRADLERQLREVEGALQRLTAAVAGGGDVPALVEAIKTHEERRKSLTGRLEALAAPVPAFDGALEARLRVSVEEWREILGRQVPLARQVLGKLLEDRLVFRPEERDGAEGFLFEAAGTVDQLIAGAVGGPDFLGVVSPTGFEPVLPA